MVNKNFINFILFVCVFMTGVVVHKQANASLMITPTTVVFEGRDRYADVILVNVSETERQYKMSFIYHEMLPETGGYKLLDSLEEGEFDLSKYIVISPKQVRLAPGAKQKIRLALRRPAEIPQGDHHVHLKFESLPIEDDVKQVHDKVLDENKISASVSIQLNFTIPVILREGESDAVAEIGQISFERNKGNGRLDALVPVTRSAESPFSILGYFNVYHIDEGGKEEKVGDLLNVNVFPEINSRVFTIPLKKDITGGSLRVVLEDYKKDGTVYTEKTFALEQ